MINYNIKINAAADKTYYSDIVFTTGDIRAYKFVFDFVGIDTQNCTMAIKAKRADGNIVIGKTNDCNEFVLPGNMYSVPGELMLEIAVYDASGGCVTTKVVAANVREGFGEEGLVADDRYPILTSMIKDVDALKLSVETAISELGDIAASLDAIITIQQRLIGGDV